MSYFTLVRPFYHDFVEMDRAATHHPYVKYSGSLISLLQMQQVVGG
jgi:hypothetical protein